MCTMAGSTADEMAVMLVRNAKTKVTTRVALMSLLKSIISCFLSLTRHELTRLGKHYFTKFGIAPDLMRLN